jgi:hypothetical protein
MYQRCLFCNGFLGHNRALEELPIGRRLAYDQARGRLWVICPACCRWNLTPIDERWEAIESCERAFRTTRVRASSENVSLAQLAEGLELVRIGRPLPVEFAAWRYGRHFLRRYRRRALGLAGRGGLLATAPLAALAAGPPGALAMAGIAGAAALALWRRAAAVVPLEHGGLLRLNLHHLQRASLRREESNPDGWALCCEHLPGPSPALVSVRAPAPLARRVELTGPNARAAAALILPRLNQGGGDAETVREAAQWVQAAGGPELAFRTMAQSSRVRPPLRMHDGTLATLHDPARLALEMAVHEAEEQRHLAGELSVLTWMWRRAEYLAAIADGLGLPEWLEQHKARLRAPA